MSSFVRSSKFRNIVVKPFKRENTYENIQVSDGSAVVSGRNCIGASTRFLAYIDKSSSEAIGFATLLCGQAACASPFEDLQTTSHSRK